MYIGMCTVHNTYVQLHVRVQLFCEYVPGCCFVLLFRPHTEIEANINGLSHLIGCTHTALCVCMLSFIIPLP